MSWLAARRLALALGIPALLGACATGGGARRGVVGARDLLRVPGPPAASPGLALSRTDLEDDLVRLIYAVDHGYAGPRLFPPETLAGLREGLWGLPEALGAPADSRALCEGLAALFERVPDPGLEARLPGGERCGKTPSEPGGGSSAGPGRVWRVDASRAELRIGLREFPARADARWTGFLEAVEAGLARRPRRVTLDLRGAGGDSDAMPLELAARFWGARYGTGVTRFERRSRAMQALRVNAARREAETGGPEAAAALAAAEAEFARIEAGEEEPEREERAGVPPSERRLLPGGVSTPIAILQDRGCASGCEALLAAMLGHPAARSFGQASAGSMNLGGPGELRLARSGVVVRLATAASAVTDGERRMGIGFAPDFPLPIAAEPRAALARELGPKGWLRPGGARGSAEAGRP